MKSNLRHAREASVVRLWMKRLFFALPAAMLLFMGATMAVGAPKRVVSMNVCTDQLAMLIAAEGQLHSVSFLAADPAMSVLFKEAGRYRFNHSQAEEIFLMYPDLVLAGTYTSQVSVSLLRRLGLHVEIFTAESGMEDIRANIARMGELLGRQERAGELIAGFDRGLAELAANRPPRRTVALYYDNSYTSGRGTLADAVVRAAGLDNLTDRLGLTGSVKLPLELLVLSAPDLVMGGDGFSHGPALARENFTHPAYRALLGSARTVSIGDAYTICGTPFTLEAARRLQAAAWSLEEAR